MLDITRFNFASELPYFCDWLIDNDKEIESRIVRKIWTRMNPKKELLWSGVYKYRLKLFIFYDVVYSNLLYQNSFNNIICVTRENCKENSFKGYTTGGFGRFGAKGKINLKTYNDCFIIFFKYTVRLLKLFCLEKFKNVRNIN